MLIFPEQFNTLSLSDISNFQWLLGICAFKTFMVPYNIDISWTIRYLGKNFYFQWLHGTFTKPTEKSHSKGKFRYSTWCMTEMFWEASMNHQVFN